MQLTPASWEWSQEWSPSPVNLLHPSRELSVPEQLSWSRKMGPAPWPNWEPVKASTPSVMGSDECKYLYMLNYVSVWAHHRVIHYSPPPFVCSRPSCRHTTKASSFVNPLSHTVPQASLMQISTLPSASLAPPTSLSAPLVQLPAEMETPVCIHNTNI